MYSARKTWFGRSSDISVFAQTLLALLGFEAGVFEAGVSAASLEPLSPPPLLGAQSGAQFQNSRPLEQKPSPRAREAFSVPGAVPGSSLAAGGAVAAAPSNGVSVIVSVADQKMVLWKAGVELARFPVSTSRFGLGDRQGSYATPVGELQVAVKIGDGVREGTVFKERRPTREVLAPNAPGRDPIVTRIVWLRGLEPQNANSFGRYIYIHGTPEERLLGTPVSWGCVRMASKDVVKLFESIDVGTKVEIINKPLKVLLKEHAAMDRLAQNLRAYNSRD